MGYSGNLMGTRVGDIMTTSPRTVLLSQKAAQAMDVSVLGRGYGREGGGGGNEASSACAMF